MSKQKSYGKLQGSHLKNKIIQKYCKRNKGIKLVPEKISTNTKESSKGCGKINITNI
jgi:hypothetical protein